MPAWLSDIAEGDCGEAGMVKERDWRRFALLLIDVQVDFYGPKIAERFGAFPANVSRLLSLCRKEGIEVVHLRAGFEPDMSDWMPWSQLDGSLPCIRGTAGAEVLPCAQEAPGETVIVKQTFDGFHQPALLHTLQQSGKRFLLTAGLVTSVCVFFTTISAVQMGFLSAVVEDCCACLGRHGETLDRLEGFTQGRTVSDRIPDHYPEWQAALEKLDALEKAGV